MTCNPCEGTGWMNTGQLPRDVDPKDGASVQRWVDEQPAGSHDVTPCLCCGDVEGWYGAPGEHYRGGDLPGPHGPYAYNGGLPACS